MSWKDYLYFHKRDKNAIILLLVLILLSLIILFIVNQNSSTSDRIEDTSLETKAEFVKFETELADKAEETNRNSPTTASENKYTKTTKYIRQEKLEKGETIELNSSDTTILKKVPGIGSSFANRIIKYRNLLGGYYKTQQIKEVWGIDDDMYNKIIPYFVVSGQLKKVKVNTATFSQLRKHPYISYQQATVIIDIRERKGNIESVNRLALLDEFTENDIARLTPYLAFD